jgi:methionyl aminopeptidase
MVPITEIVKCENKGCGNVARFKCPSCIPFGINTYYCSQDCFRSSWPNHKLVHTLSQYMTDASNESKDPAGAPPDNYNAYPNYRYSGKLRPWPTTPKRSVPETIAKPEYATTGIPKEELKKENIISVEILNERDQETIRRIGKVILRVLLRELIRLNFMGELVFSLEEKYSI